MKVLTFKIWITFILSPANIFSLDKSGNLLSGKELSPLFARTGLKQTLPSIFFIKHPKFQLYLRWHLSIIPVFQSRQPFSFIIKFYMCYIRICQGFVEGLGRDEVLAHDIQLFEKSRNKNKGDLDLAKDGLIFLTKTKPILDSFIFKEVTDDHSKLMFFKHWYMYLLLRMWKVLWEKKNPGYQN